MTAARSGAVCGNDQEEQVRALKVALEETAQRPEAQQAFQAAFGLYRQHKHGEPPAKSK